MSLHTLYSIRDFQKTEGAFSAVISFDPEHEIFSGHFPGQPVVPGVCLIHILKEITGLLLKTELSLKSGSNIKFLHIVNPRENTEVQIKGTYKPESNSRIKITTSIFSGETVFLKFNGHFSTETMKH